MLTFPMAQPTNSVLPTGGVLLAAGVVMILVGHSGDDDEEAEARLGITPLVGAEQAGVLFEGRF